MNWPLLSLAFFLVSTCARADDNQAGIFVVSGFLIISVTLVLIYQSKNRPRNYSRSEMDSLQERAKESFDNLKEEGITSLTDVPILLRSGETAFLTEPSDLFELETSYITSGISGSGDDFNVGVARSTPVEQMDKIDSGNLTLTDQRVAFSGRNKTRDFELSTILDVKVHGNCVEIGSVQGGKHSLFSVKNSVFWKNYIDKLVRGDKPGSKGGPGSKPSEGGFQRKVRGTPDMKPFDPIE